jgi:hypothetical protein
MRALTEDALLLCDHGGQVKLAVHQSWVTINRRRVLVATDPESRSISGCPNTNPLLGLKPCTNTLRVTRGYSEFMRIDGRRVCLDAVTGLTDGTPQGAVKYTVKNPGQTLVKSDS